MHEENSTHLHVSKSNSTHPPTTALTSRAYHLQLPIWAHLSRTPSHPLRSAPLRSVPTCPPHTSPCLTYHHHPTHRPEPSLLQDSSSTTNAAHAHTANPLSQPRPGPPVQRFTPRGGVFGATNCMLACLRACALRSSPAGAALAALDGCMCAGVPALGWVVVVVVVG